MASVPVGQEAEWLHVARSRHERLPFTAMRVLQLGGGA